MFKMRTLALMALFIGMATFSYMAGCDSNSDSGDGSDSDTDSDSDSDTDADSDSDSDSDPPRISITLSVPDTFDGTPESLEIFFFEDDNYTVEPYAFGEIIPSPDIGVGNPLELETNQAGLNGDYYMVFVLYCDGGGDGMEPVSGVDWVGFMDGPLSLAPTTGTVDAGEVELVPAP